MPAEPPPRFSRLILDLANAQHGVVGREQLLTAGVPEGLLKGRLESLQLTSVYPGVFTVGHSRLTISGQWMAAVLATGAAASLCHRTAAAHWGLIPPPGHIDVMRTTSMGRSVPRYSGRPAPFGRPIRFHRSRWMDAADFEIRNGIRVTTIPRTFLDLASIWNIDQLDSAFSQADREGLIRFSELKEAAQRGKGWTGVGKLREVIAGWDPESTRTKSELENAFQRVCHRHRIPIPDVNVMVAGFEVDCFWRDEGLIVELDSFRHHRSPRELERDKERTAALEDRGYRVLRLSYRMVTREELKTAERVKHRLNHSSVLDSR